MSDEQQIKARLRAAIFAAIAELGEEKAKKITNECFKTLDDDWYGRR